MLDYDVLIEHREPSGVGGGTFTNANTQPMILNSVTEDDKGLIDFLDGTNYWFRFNLEGVYAFAFFSNAQGQSEWRTTLANYDGDADLILGTSQRCAINQAVSTTSTGFGQIVVPANQRMYLRMDCQLPNTSVNLRGYPVNSGSDEIYQQLLIKKLA